MSKQRPQDRDDHLDARRVPQGTLAYSESRTLHIGPLPDPETFDRYNQIVPGSAERLLAANEKQSAHRQKLESWSIIGGTFQSFLGTICATGVTIFVIYECTKVILAGYTVAGMAGIIFNLGTLAGVFVYGRRKQSQELGEKRKNN